MPSSAALSRNLGIHVFGFAAIALGIIGLVWGDFATVWQPVPADTPHRTALAYIVAVLLLASGAAVQRRQTAQAGISVLTVLHLISALLWLPRVIGFPRMIGTWLGFAEEFALVAAGAVAYASLAPPESPWTGKTIRIARFLFGLCPLVFGLAHFMALKETMSMVPRWIPPGVRFWAIATGVGHVLAGVSILTGVMAGLASRLLTAMLLTFGALVWLPSLFGPPDAHLMWSGNAINLALAGAAWIISDSILKSKVRLLDA
jgi:uncharacterized membrane protein YphA (DoxX/SURF4 family)